MLQRILTRAKLKIHDLRKAAATDNVVGMYGPSKNWSTAPTPDQDKIAEHAKEDVSLVKKLELYENEIEKDEYINTIFEDNIDKYVPPSAPTITVPMPNLSKQRLKKRNAKYGDTRPSRTPQRSTPEKERGMLTPMQMALLFTLHKRDPEEWNVVRLSDEFAVPQERMSLLLDYHQQPVIFNSIHGDNIGKWTDEPTMNRADNAQYRKTLVEHLYMNTGSELGAQRARKAQQDNVNRLADEREYNEEMEGGGDNEHLWYKPHPSQVQLPQHRSF